MSERIVVISGPTASGKSDLALHLADSHDIAIINADSLQIYEGLPILSSQPFSSQPSSQVLDGVSNPVHMFASKNNASTNLPLTQTLGRGQETPTRTLIVNGIPHFLYSHLKPCETSSVGMWLKLVKSTVDKVIAEKKLPIIVGGSGMYISKLIEGISEIPEISEEIKIEAREYYDEIGPEEFSKKIDAELDKQRAIRAYEVLLFTGKPISFWQNKPLKKIFPKADFLHVNLNPPREKLYENCNSRFKKMLDCEAPKEVQNLINQGVEDDWQITKTLGFQEIRDFLNEKITKEKMIETATQKTRNYAKRQLTWFRNQSPEKRVFVDSNAALNFLKNEI